MNCTHQHLADGYNRPTLFKSLSCQFFSLELASDGLKGHVFEYALADIHKDDTAYRKFRLIVEEIQGRNCLTNFHGMALTTDRIRSLVKKWQVQCSGTVSIDSVCVCVCVCVFRPFVLLSVCLSVCVRLLQC